jgi:acyl-CoA thioesterase
LTYSFIMDTALSFIPLSLTGIPLTSARAASSLDFSLRFFCAPPKALHKDWLLHEQYTQRAEEGRSFSVGRMYRQDGAEVARMSQVSILRVPEGIVAKNGPGRQAKL